QPGQLHRGQQGQRPGGDAGVDGRGLGELRDVRSIRRTATSPGCPVAGSLPGDVEAKVRRVPGVTSAKVDVVWDPPWDKDRMSEAAKLQLGIDDS
ncbi:MAG TPA: iron-sulfur cluster assembly protein, partial [Gemmataceae bacterium]|nr:iron-sulfur cluster assembly protein [Gemmataceae bacterium]